jgi:hypothetical protein
VKKSGENPIIQYVFRTFSRFWLINSYRFYSMPDRYANWIRVRVFRKHKKFNCVKRTEGQSKDLAIIALWPRLGILPSVVNQIEILLQLNQEVICVINKSKFSSTWLKTLEQFPITILIRENIGRDFGAYKAGFEYVSNEYGLDYVDNLTFSNDTIFFAKDSIDVIRDTLSLDGDVKSLFLNLQEHLHAQSFFISFSKSALLSEPFSKFWRNYYPSNERVHAINNGEVKLSRYLNKANFKFVSYVNAERLGKIFSDYKPFTLSELGACYDIEGDAHEIRKRTYLSHEYHRLQAERIIVSRNASHLLGLYLFRVNSVPLKLDLMMRAFHSSSDLYEVLKAKGFSSEALSDYESMLYKQGSWNTLRGIRVLWRQHGFI